MTKGITLSQLHFLRLTHHSKQRHYVQRNNFFMVYVTLFVRHNRFRIKSLVFYKLRCVNINFQFSQTCIKYYEDWKMFTQRSQEHEWFYSLKVLAHFRSKELVDFSTYDTQISGSTVKHVLRNKYSWTVLPQYVNFLTKKTHRKWRFSFNNWGSKTMVNSLL